MLQKANQILIPKEMSSWLGPGRAKEVMLICLSVFSQCFGSSQLQSRLAVVTALRSPETLSTHTAYGTFNMVCGC